MIELCRKQLERTGKKPSGKEAPLEDMHSLQQRLAEIERQMKKVESQIHVDTNTPPVTFSSSVTTRKAPTPAEIVRHQREALVELEQQVAQRVNPAAKQPISTVSSSTADSDNKSVACTDPMNLFRGLLMSNSGDSLNTSKPNAPAANKTASSTDSTLFAQSSRDPFNNPLFKMEQMARHPGGVGVCLGCLDDDSQDRALLTLTKLSEQWNAETDSDSDD
ncbi:unnamed protein product [Cylicostephanus goldi]|uniref:Uncharacterized protein n=1 Tax=Cylicostephanus goldi TaxID=71465 RepID=A0A3P6RXI0_CYLGO|nr:unnamed protein product [Cylicostephanus goldi]